MNYVFLFLIHEWLDGLFYDHQGQVGYMVECTDQMLRSLEAEVESGQTEVEIGNHFTKLTGDIIARTEFDSSYEKGKKIFHLLTSLQSLAAQSSRHLWLPGSRWGRNNTVPLPYYLSPWGADGWQMLSSFRESERDGWIYSIQFKVLKQPMDL